MVSISGDMIVLATLGMKCAEYFILGTRDITVHNAILILHFRQPKLVLRVS